MTNFINFAFSFIDDEFQLLFNGAISNDVPNDSVEPDLKGIADLLRMVEHDESSSRESPADISISKLNPNISEFAPKDGEFQPLPNGAVSNDIPNGSVKPDLKGITDLLRMVEDNESSSRDSPTDVISISKLNPNVREFVPNGIIVQNNTSENNNKVKSAVSNVNRSLADDVGEEDYTKTHSEASNVNKSLKNNVNSSLKHDVKAQANDFTKILGNKIDLSELKPKDINDVADKLRDKISDSSRAVTPQQKKERNVAITALLKLYSAKLDDTAQSKTDDHENEPLKLVTPDFFVKNEKSEYTCNKTSEDEEDSYEESIHNENVKENITNDRTSTDFCVPTSVDSSVQESIDKVNTWFNDSKSSPVKRPIVSFEPPIFKKKEQRNIQSPKPDADQMCSKGTSSHSALYKPSKYAEDLCKIYTKRTEQRNNESQNIWTKLEAQLRAKDEKLKKEKVEEQNGI